MRAVSVGIMSFRNRTGGTPFAEAGYFRQVINAAKKLSIRAFVFCPLDIDWRSRTIDGYVYDDNTGGWQAKQFPFPDVVYDRLFPPRGRLANLLFAAAKRLRTQGNVQMFGRAFRGKWEVYSALLKHPDVKEHIPETRPLHNLADLDLLLRKHGYVFIKPDMGSQGAGVLSIRATANGYNCRGRDYRNTPYKVRTHSLAHVLAVAKSASQRRRLLVQQGLELSFLQGRTFDVRAVVQKDHEGKWQLTGTAVRIGRPGSVTSNLHGGGHAARTEALIKSAFPHKHSEIMETLGRLAIRIPEAIDQELGRYGELGLDFGVDKDGKIWLIEANSKPGRTVFLRTGDYTLRKISIARPMQYSRYLALRKRNGGEEGV